MNQAIPDRCLVNKFTHLIYTYKLVSLMKKGEESSNCKYLFGFHAKNELK